MKSAIVVFLSLAIGCVSAVASAKDWSALNSTVQGRLIQHAPFSRPCFQDSTATGGNFDPAQCALVQDNYNNTFFRIANAGSYEGLQWEGCPAKSEGCFLDSFAFTDPAAFAPPQVCHQGSVPSYFIDVRSASDAQAAFKFVERTGVELVIKNSGHDYQGRSARPGSLALWTNNMKEITFNHAFKPTGCSSATARSVVTMAAGVEITDVYAFGAAHNLTIPGGACGTVGIAGGYVMGGGHSALSNTFGLAVDRALEFRVVVPTGKFLIANECQNTDLYFALRGGGGGTFGLVMEVVTLAFPATPVEVFVLDNIPVDNATTRGLYGVIVDNSLPWAKSGWGGYVSPNGLQYINPVASAGKAKSDMDPLRSFAKSVNATIIEKTLPAFVDFYTEFLLPVDQLSGVQAGLGSRLIPAKNYESAASRSELVDAIINAQAGHAVAFMFTVTPFSFKPDNLTSVTPAWRNSITSVLMGDLFNFDTTPAEQAAILAALTTSTDVLRNITPDSGAYVNESDLHEPDFESAFWGENYPRLLAIKNKYDPLHILDCWHCVGWKGKDDPNYQCYI